MAANNQNPADGQGRSGQTPPPDDRLKFKKVSKSWSTSGGAHRTPAKIAISTTGACRTNLEGKEAFLRWVRSLLADHTRFSVTFGGNEDAGTMAIYYAKEEDTGAMLVTQKKTALYFHCGACFADNPLLRPATTVDCSFAPGFDADGDPCLIVNISGGSPSRIVKRKKDPQAQAQKKTGEEKKA